MLHQRVGIPVTDESPACEADEALGVVLQLPGHHDQPLGDVL